MIDTVYSMIRSNKQREKFCSMRIKELVFIYLNIYLIGYTLSGLGNVLKWVEYKSYQFYEHKQQGHFKKNHINISSWNMQLTKCKQQTTWFPLAMLGFLFRRVGRWITDISPLLPMIQNNQSDTCTFTMKTAPWAMPWIPSLNLRLYKTSGNL